MPAKFGLSCREIAKDGFQITRKVQMLTSSDTQVGIAKSIGIEMVGFADKFADLQRGLILVPEPLSMAVKQLKER